MYNKIMKKYFLVTALFFTLLLSGKLAFGQTAETTAQETLEGVVTEVLEQKISTTHSGVTSEIYQNLEVLVTRGSLKDRIIRVEVSAANNNAKAYEKSDRVFIEYKKDETGAEETFTITDHVRGGAIIFLAVIFILLVLVVSKKWGITSLLGTIFSLAVIWKFIVPFILKGYNPILVTIIGSLIIIPVSFYLSYGYTRKTHIAILSTYMSLILTGILAGIFVEITKLSGYTMAESSLLEFVPGSIDVKGLALSAIIIGALGVLDDVTISQASVVLHLRDSNKEIPFNELYKMSMSIGQDHISSTVNTLIIVYAASAMPLFLLFSNAGDLSEIINYEVVADEIVRTLVGSIGLVLSVPITTFLAIFTPEESLS